MPIRRVAEDVFHIPLTPRDGVNAYLLGDVVVDAGHQGHGEAPDQGAARPRRRRPRARPMATPTMPAAPSDWSRPSTFRSGSASAIAPTSSPGGRPRPRRGPGRRWRALSHYEPVGVARSLHEGDELGHGFVVLETPGHSDGHVAFWRESDRTLVAGDVLFNLNVLTTAPGLREPPRILTRDPAAQPRERPAPGRAGARARALRPRAAAARPRRADGVRDALGA